jgi:hypothetical protein
MRYLIFIWVLFCVSCGPSRDSQGNEWKRSQVWKRVTAGKLMNTHYLECPKNPNR